jgi:hypothetical protein
VVSPTDPVPLRVRRAWMPLLAWDDGSCQRRQPRLGIIIDASGWSRGSQASWENPIQVARARTVDQRPLLPLPVVGTWSRDSRREDSVSDSSEPCLETESARAAIDSTRRAIRSWSGIGGKGISICLDALTTECS